MRADTALMGCMCATAMELDSQVPTGLAMNGVRRSENGCSCSVFCSAFGSERVRHLVRLLFVFGVRGLLCSCSCSDCLFVVSSVFRSYPHVDVECSH